MADPEAVVERMADAVQEIVIHCPVWTHQMRGQGDLGGAGRPDVDMMNPADTGEGSEERFYRQRVDP